MPTADTDADMAGMALRWLTWVADPELIAIRDRLQERLAELKHALPILHGELKHYPSGRVTFRCWLPWEKKWHISARPKSYGQPEYRRLYSGRSYMAVLDNPKRWVGSVSGLGDG